MDSDFAKSLALARARIEPHLRTEEARERLAAPERGLEIEAAAPCARRFAECELDPGENLGVGRLGPVSMVPALARLAGRRRIAALAPPERDQALHAVLAALAFGYVGVVVLEVAALEPEARVEFESEQLWRIWVAALNAEMRKLAGIDDPGRIFIARQATDVFRVELASSRLRVAKRMRLNALGEWYAEAGMVLRLVQTWGRRSDDPVSDLEEAQEGWPFAEAQEGWPFAP